MYAFAHALVRSTLYEELPTVARLRLHRRIGWSLDGETRRAIDGILREIVTDPVGPEFMAPPARAPLRAVMRGAVAS